MAEKKASIVAGKKASLAGAAATLGVTADASSALNLTPEEALAAKEAEDRLDIRALPVRQYLEASVVPLLLRGLQLLAIESISKHTPHLRLKVERADSSRRSRPENPIAFLAHFLIENNPMNKKNPLKEETKDEKKEE